MADETKMPAQFARAARNAEGIGRARVVADFIAGMTDRYAIAAHEVLTA